MKSLFKEGKELTLEEEKRYEELEKQYIDLLQLGTKFIKEGRSYSERLEVMRKEVPLLEEMFELKPGGRREKEVLGKFKEAVA